LAGHDPLSDFSKPGITIYIAGRWMLSSAQANPSDTQQLTLAALLLGLGFAFWLGVFPFHIWIPELAEETHPYVAGFLLSIYPLVSILILLNFLDGIVWLKNAAFLAPVIRIVGTVMVLSGGFGAAIQKDLRRIFGFAVIFESGFALLAIGLQTL
jgi:formate hydrogenlyase subunit 3/multisubunit Na+/H+ antiporter MnhD subunit